MSDNSIPEVVFNPDAGVRIFPRPQHKQAVLVSIPTTSDENVLPTFIKPEWDGVQVFYGDYYAIIVDGRVVYGSAKDQWENMHTRVADQTDRWIKTAVPKAYMASEPCRIVTLIPGRGGGEVRETNYNLNPGDWIVRQPGGEIQHIKADYFPAIYFSDEEAKEAGLPEMSDAEFANWAIAQALVSA